MKIHINPSIVLFLIGTTGLLFTFVDNTGGKSSKIPLAIMFIFIMGLGILLQALPKENIDGIFGETDRPRGFG